MIDFGPARALRQNNSRHRVAAIPDTPVSRVRRIVASSRGQVPNRVAN
jgi:hypothetical protein